MGTEARVALTACITALAAAVGSSDHYKTINSSVLLHMRSEKASTRLAAIQCEMSLTNQLGEEWLSLLPEMLPFISEAMEDDSEDVEAGVREWVKSIEEILGESLDPMLQ